MVRGRRGGGAEDPLGDLLENMKQNSVPGLFFSSSSAPDYNSVVLDDWWLVRAGAEGESKKLAISGYIAKKASNRPFISAPIVKRHDTFTLEAADGVIVKVEGMINLTNTQNNGFSREVCQHFNIGFPFLWKQYINSGVDSTPSLGGTSTFKIFEHFLSGNSSGINDENLEDPLGSMAEEFETAPEDDPTSDDNNMAAEADVNLEKENTVINNVSDAPQDGRSKRFNENETDKEPSMEDTTPHSGNNLRRQELDNADIEHEESATPEKNDTSSNSKLPTRKRKGAVAGAKVSAVKSTSRKRSSKKDTVLQGTPDTTGLGHHFNTTEVPDVTPSSRTGSRKKDHVLQTTPKTTGLGRPRTNTKADRATITPLSSDSNVRRSRSGRVLISAVDKGSQKVLYDKNGNFLGIKTVS